ncbi:MAG: hypothetical protein JWN46_3376 [Acidimicrobiales bacterium]|nr:hypothetical protein [Acidimicrobiales bacterium]
MAASLAPMVALGFHLLGMVALPLGAGVLVLPTLAVTVVVLARDRQLRHVWLRGLMAGLIAVTVYDLFRLPLVALGVWEDFIPRIGRWALGGHRGNWVLGYVWRYFGDGGLMGVCFVVASRPGQPTRTRVAHGTIFGTVVWVNLMAVAVVERNAHTGLFPVTPTTVAASLVGHLIYGVVLGWASARLDPAASEPWVAPAAARPDEPVWLPTR